MHIRVCVCVCVGGGARLGIFKYHIAHRGGAVLKSVM